MEIHAHKTREVYDVVETATGSRSQSLIFTISTAGTILDGIATELWEYGEQILDPEKPDIVDETFFAALYTIDKGDKFDDESVWIKANPCLDFAKSRSDMRNLCNKAKVQVSARGNYLTKHLNVFTNVSTAWLSNAVVKANEDESLKLEDFEGAHVSIGIDLAERNDICSVQTIIEKSDDNFLIFTKAFLPRSAIDKAPAAQKYLYEKWEAQGWLTVLDGDVVDFDNIQDYILELNTKFTINAVSYDPYKATQMVTKLEAKGIKCISIGQNVKMLSEVTQNFESQMLTHKITYDGSPVFRWCCNNAVLKTKVNGCVGVEKERPSSPNKIDCLVATLIGLRGHQEVRSSSSVYNDDDRRESGILVF